MSALQQIKTLKEILFNLEAVVSPTTPNLEGLEKCANDLEQAGEEVMRGSVQEPIGSLLQRYWLRQSSEVIWDDCIMTSTGLKDKATHRTVPKPLAIDIAERVALISRHAWIDAAVLKILNKRFSSMDDLYSSREMSNDLEASIGAFPDFPAPLEDE